MFNKCIALFASVILALSLVQITNASEHEGKTLQLFNGKNLDGWKALWQSNEWVVAEKITLQENDPTKFKIHDGTGIMVNGPKGNTTNLLSEYQHGDCKLHIEFTVSKGSNSGVYFQGLYEIQVLDSYGKGNDDVKHSDCGGIYQRWDPSRGEGNEGFEGHPPRVNASKAPGVWQSFDVIFRAPRFDQDGNKTENAKFVEVKHNGVLVHKNVEVKGRTRASLNEKQQPESPKGPLMLQGDHGPVAYRNIKLTPLNLD